MSRAGLAPPLPGGDFYCREIPGWFGISGRFVGDGLDRPVRFSRYIAIPGGCNGRHSSRAYGRPGIFTLPLCRGRGLPRPYRVVIFIAAKCRYGSVFPVGL